LIAGVHKAATTSMFTYFAQHPSVCGSSKKEIHHYTPLRYGGETPSLVEYSQYFKTCGNKPWRMEASPSYLYVSCNVIDQICKDLNEARFIFILREPTARFSSFYKHCVSKYLIPENTSFKQFCNESFQELSNPIKDTPVSRGLREGNYSQYLTPWLSLGPEKVRIVNFEDFTKDPRKVMIALSDWLHIDSKFYSNYEFEIENKTVGSKSKFLFRMAQSINSNLEAFWRKNPIFKRTIRSLYYRLNGKTIVAPIDSESLQLVKDYYLEEKRQLKLLLESHGIQDLPKWLLEI
jgi:hypothetical protein